MKTRVLGIMANENIRTVDELEAWVKERTRTMGSRGKPWDKAWTVLRRLPNLGNQGTRVVLDMLTP
jgi:hypothetical protein